MNQRGNVTPRYSGAGAAPEFAGRPEKLALVRTQTPTDQTSNEVTRVVAPKSVAPKPDEILLRRAARGDHEAFAELYLRHRRQLMATALRTIRIHSDAEDCLQDAMLRAYQLSPTFRGDCRVASWLHRIVVNACLDRARRNQIRASLPMPDDLSSIASDEGRGAEEMDRTLSVATALAMLPEDQRAAVIAVDMNGLSVAQAADVLGVAVGTVKSRRARARARLERLLC